MSCKYCDGTDEIDYRDWCIFGKYEADILYCPMCGESLAEQKPLTQLEMIDWPVNELFWVVGVKDCKDSDAGWCYMNHEADVFSIDGGYVGDIDDYGKTWVARRRPPRI